MNAPLPRDDYRIAPAVARYPRRTQRLRSDVLKLHETVLLRRLLAGETQMQAARALGWSKNTVTSMTRYLRVRFEVDTVDDLLALPRVREQLRESGAS